ncbi:MAG: response regulator [Maritimibacter sp.]|nr:response regulator [Maritimibacter sp.]
MRILAVDDDDMHLSVLSLMLREIQFDDVTLAQTPAEALGRIAEARMPFDCILLDIEMPQKSGIELCHEIRRLPGYAEVPILMLTRLSDRGNMDAAFDAGATDYVTKPIDKLEFFTRLRIAKTMRERQQQIAEQDAVIEAYKDSTRQPRINLAEPIELDDVIGAIDYTSFENFLLKAATEATNLDVFALKIGNIEELFNTVSEADFRFVVNSVGDAIAEVLAYRSFSLSYAGSGVFAVVMRDGLELDIEDVARQIYSYTPELGIPVGDGVTLLPDLHVGAAMRSPFFPRRPNLQVLAAAIDAAEQAAATPRKDYDPDRAKPATRKVPFLGTRKAS